METHTPNYHAYLLRCWRDDEHTPWRFQLEDPHTGERRGFDTPEKILKFLNHRMENTVIIKADIEGSS